MQRRSFLKLAALFAASLAVSLPSSIDLVPVRRAMLCDLNAIFAAESERLASALRAHYLKPSPWFQMLSPGVFPAGMGEVVG